MNGSARRVQGGRTFDSASGRILEAAIAVHRAMGPGFLESVYDRALRVALEHRSVPYSAQVPIELTFEGQSIGRGRIDLIVLDAIIVEVKAVPVLAPVHFCQLRSYLTATGLHIGLLLNFNTPVLTIKRVVV